MFKGQEEERRTEKARAGGPGPGRHLRAKVQGDDCREDGVVRNKSERKGGELEKELHVCASFYLPPEHPVSFLELYYSVLKDGSNPLTKSPLR